MPLLHPPLPGPSETSRLDTTALRTHFLLGGLFAAGELRRTLTDLDRVIVGGACPLPGLPLELTADESLKAATFCERRELGVINLGGPGRVEVDGQTHELNPRDCLYVGRGTRLVAFQAGAAAEPAAFLLISYPAHATHPTCKATPADANILRLGTREDANERTLHQYIHEGGIRSCQLVMGFTELAPGSVWNTMPPHTHTRRSEVYAYFNVPSGHAVLHTMGEPQQTRPLWVADREVVLSPAWSIHTGVGTRAYSFVWAMGGENQRFDDMDRVAITALR
jgi:4-deoxy-L-threo-5-hexosulose-uronate ketol-isomerase